MREDRRFFPPSGAFRSLTLLGPPCEVELPRRGDLAVGVWLQRKKKEISPRQDVT